MKLKCNITSHYEPKKMTVRPSDSHFLFQSDCGGFRMTVKNTDNVCKSLLVTLTVTDRILPGLSMTVTN